MIYLVYLFVETKIAESTTKEGISTIERENRLMDPREGSDSLVVEENESSDEDSQWTDVGSEEDAFVPMIDLSEEISARRYV